MVGQDRRHRITLNVSISPKHNIEGSGNMVAAALSLITRHMTVGKR
jgi:hypothetical protein